MKSNLRCAVLTLSFWSILTLTTVREAAAQSGGVSWQQSQAPSVTLGVRDKYGTLGNYTARFIISDSAGHRVQKSIAVHADAFGSMVYPDDIALLPLSWKSSGNYSWVCVVRSSIVARGKFSLAYTNQGAQLRIIDPF